MGMARSLDPSLFKLVTKESAVQILTEDFPRHQWPVSGGWGYDETNPVKIEVDSESDGIAMEHKFAKYRTYEELIIFRPENDSAAGIRLNLIKQSLINAGGIPLDVLEYEITAWPEKIWDELKKEYEDNRGFADNPEGLKAHMEKNDKYKFSYVTKVYFDISRFFKD